MTSVFLEIKSCRECPHRKTRRFYTADSWEHVTDWYCTKIDRPMGASTDTMPDVENSNSIAHVEWSRDEPKKIPDWCPLRVES